MLTTCRLRVKTCPNQTKVDPGVQGHTQGDLVGQSLGQIDRDQDPGIACIDQEAGGRGVGDHDQGVVDQAVEVIQVVQSSVGATTPRLNWTMCLPIQ